MEGKKTLRTLGKCLFWIRDHAMIFLLQSKLEVEDVRLISLDFACN